MNERTILLRIKHPYIARCYATFQDRRSLYMVLEYVPGGELFTLLRTRRRLAESAARLYAAQIVVALAHLHSHEIVYRDIKPENVLLDRHGRVKLVDFGFARFCHDKAWTICGTPEYLAPEIILSRGHDFGADWWALGVLIYEMLAGFPPHQSDDHMQLYSAILKGDVRFPQAVLPDVNAALAAHLPRLTSLCRRATSFCRS